jgi:hypothetical protein
MNIMTIVDEKALANFVPAAAVIRRGQVLLIMTGRKACVGGKLSYKLKTNEKDFESL